MKLAIFDLDGVLADTAHAHTCALFYAVHTTLGADASTKRYLNASDGVRTVTKLQRLKGDFNLHDGVVALIDSKKKAMTLELLRAVQPDFETIAGFQQLKEAGLSIAVCSNSRREFVSIVLDNAWLTDLVDLVICGNEVTNPKPHPEIFVAAMEHFGVSPEETTIFEDSPTGQEAARASGANLIEVDPSKLVTLDQIRSILPT